MKGKYYLFRVPLLTSLIIFPFSYIYSQDAQQQITQEEALFVRRILEFWKDKEPAIVKSQIAQFIDRYPNSEYVDSLLVILGDTLWGEHKYDEALKAYDKIKSPLYRDKVFNNRLDSLYHLEKYQALAHEIAPKLPKDNLAPETAEQALWMFYYAEALLQEAKQMPESAESQKKYEEARHYYYLLLDTEHNVNAKLALGEIHSSLGDHKLAADHYLELAEAMPDKQEEMLFQAAQLLSSYAPEEALSLYTKIQEINGKRASQSAVNKIVLLFELNKPQQIIDEQETLGRALTEEQRPLLEFYLGRSHFALNQYDKAIEYMQPILDHKVKIPNADASIDKAVLLTLIASHYHLNELKDVDTLTLQFENEFPTDQALAKILYIQGLTYKNNGRLPEALSMMEKIEKKFLSYDKMENVEFEKSLILFKLGKWDESRKSFLTFVDKHPHSSLTLAAMQYIPGATLQQLDDAEEKKLPADGLREQLLSDIELALNTPEAVKPAQRPKYLLKGGKTLFDLKRYEDALAVLNKYIAAYPDDQNLYQGHLLMAACYQEGLKDAIGFVEHAEKVLALKHDYTDQNRLRLNLFSTYLQLSKAVGDETLQQEGPYIDKAADHLYRVVISEQEKIKPENQLWLANYFYNKVKKNANEYFITPITEHEPIEMALRAVSIYEKAFNINEEQLAKAIGPDTIYLEQELFKLSNLYGWLNRPKLQLELLQDLVEQQNANPDWSWTLRSRTAFALANAYQAQGNEEKALEYYKMLTSNLKTTDPYVSNAAKLEWARLTFANLPPEKRTIDDPDMLAILKALKDIQIRKTLTQEPIHLEAALDYAAVRASLEPEEKRDEQMRFLLARVKEEFSSKNDLWSKEYYASRQIHPDKNLVYQAYMLLIDGHIVRLEAKLAGEKGITPEQEMKNEAAESIYKSLLNGKYAVTAYLVEQAKAGLDGIVHHQSSAMEDGLIKPEA